MLLGGAMKEEDRLMASANKELALLAEKHLLNGYLGVLRGNKVIYLHTVQSSGPVVVRIAVGSQVNAHSTALGKVLLSELDHSDVKAVLGRAPYAQFTPNTLTQWSALSEELETVRAKGFALSREENINGVVFVRCGDPRRLRQDRCGAERSLPFNRTGQGRMAAAHPAVTGRRPSLLEGAGLSRRRDPPCRSDRPCRLKSRRDRAKQAARRRCSMPRA